MNSKNRLIISMVIICLVTQITSAEENDYGIVKAWCNDEPATVNGLKFKIGEPIIIKVEVTSKINGFIDLIIEEPGVTKSYNVISGPSDFDEIISEYDVEPGWTKEYTWTISPNGKWTDGNAPINIYVQLNQEIDEVEQVQFTIANPYILDEQYSGPAPTRTATDSSSTDQPPSQGSPGFGVMGALLGIVLVVVYRAGKA
jgi:sarcinarray family protein